MPSQVAGAPTPESVTALHAVTDSTHSDDSALSRNEPKPSIVLTGAGGQLGQTLVAAWKHCALAEAYELVPLTRKELDLSELVAAESTGKDQQRRASAEERSEDNDFGGANSNPPRSKLERTLDTLAPVLIINCAAYTAVDKAETDSESAFAVNAHGAAVLARWAAQAGSRLIHISTDFVFDGQATTPYSEGAATNPLGVYGASKLAGEREIQAALPNDAVIIRTSWLYSEHGANFVKTMLRLMAERDELGIVNDQIGVPTSTHSLCAVIFSAAASLLAGYKVGGVYQWCDGLPIAADEARKAGISWYDFAAEIQQQAIERGLLTKATTLNPIPTSAYPTPAKRPAYSVMSRAKCLQAFDCPRTSWQQELGAVLDQSR